LTLILTAPFLPQSVVGCTFGRFFGFIFTLSSALSLGRSSLITLSKSCVTTFTASQSITSKLTFQEIQNQYYGLGYYLGVAKDHQIPILSEITLYHLDRWGDSF
jgi:hypothetical protein